MWIFTLAVEQWTTSLPLQASMGLHISLLNLSTCTLWTWEAVQEDQGRKGQLKEKDGGVATATELQWGAEKPENCSWLE